MDGPGAAHANVRKADAAPAEECEERGQVREPGEDVGAGLADVDVSERTAEAESGHKAGPWTTSLIGAGEDLLGVC